MSHKNTKSVTLMFAKEKLVDEGFITHFIRATFRIPRPTEIVQVPVQVICGFQEKGDTVTLWMTSQEARPLIGIGISTSMMLVDSAIFDGRGVLVDLPKGAIHSVQDVIDVPAVSTAN